MMQRRSIYSLLLTSFILVFAFSTSFADEVQFDHKSVLRGQSQILNVTVDNSSMDISAFEIIFEMTSATGGAYFDAYTIDWDPAFTTLTHRYIDLSMASGAAPDTVRMAALKMDPADMDLGAGVTVVAQIDFTANYACGGTVEVAGIDLEVGQNICANTTCATTATTQFVDVAGTGLYPVPVSSEAPDGVTILTISNDPPVINPISDATIHWGDTYVGQATATDNDDPGNVTFTLVTAPAGMNINASTGVITWTTDGADICEHAVTVQVEDPCGATDETSFTICVQNDAPTFVCTLQANGNEFCPGGENVLVSGMGGILVGDMDAVDPDMGPSALMYTVNSFTGPGSINLDAATGEWSWDTPYLDPDFTGTFTLVLGVTDGAPVCAGCSPSNSDEITITIVIVPFLLTIEKTHDVYQGMIDSVDIFMLNHNYQNHEIGGFDFLVQYDQSALGLQTVQPGDFITDCDWEYFTYRQGAAGNCGSNACPSGIVRIVAIADMNDGMNHPTCFTNTLGEASNQLATMYFLVTNDRTLECQYVPVRWVWYDCGDNAISDVSGEQLYISRYLWDFEATVGDFGAAINDPSHAFPTLLGANYVCDTLNQDNPDKPELIRWVDFVNGGVDIICADSIDDRGDLNQNGLANEIADAVMFSNYFIQGLSVFGGYEQAAIAASDVNADGISLSVADLVYLIRLIVGDAVPYSKTASPVAVDYSLTESGVLSVRNADIGAAFVVMAGDVAPELLADNMDLLYAFDGTNTRILVSSLQGNSFTGDFLRVNGEIVSVEMATREGAMAQSTMVPSQFGLAQNYPNPFNPTTTIGFTLSERGEYTLTIYNVAGQVVSTHSGMAEAGPHSIEWNANGQASGIYFYKLTSANNTATKKMVLLK